MRLRFIPEDQLRPHTSTLTEANIHRIRQGEIDEGLVYDAVAAIIGRRPTSLIARETLAPRFVWRVQFEAGEPLYVKAEHEAGDDAALVLEAWAIERVRERGVPAPETIALDTTEAIFPGPVLLQREMPGVPLSPVWRARQHDEIALDAVHARAVWRAAGELLGRVHEIAVPGYGRLDDAHYAATGEVRGACTSWAEAVLQPALDAIAFMERARSLPANQLDAARRALEAHDDVFASVTDARLMHGDLAAKHIFVDPHTHEITGIIDWGDREAGDPAHDLANIALWEDDDRMEWTLEGYAGGSPGGDSPELRRRIAAYTIADGLRVAAKRFRQGRVDAAESTVAWLLPRVLRGVV